FHPGGGCSEGMPFRCGQTFCWDGGVGETAGGSGGYYYWNAIGECFFAQQAGTVWSLDTPQAFGPTLRVDQTTGEVVCPDGSKINVGGSFAACAAIQALLTPPATCVPSPFCEPPNRSFGCY